MRWFEGLVYDFTFLLAAHWFEIWIELLRPSFFSHFCTHSSRQPGQGVANKLNLVISNDFVQRKIFHPDVSLVFLIEVDLANNWCQQTISLLGLWKSYPISFAYLWWAVYLSTSPPCCFCSFWVRFTAKTSHVLSGLKFLEFLRQGTACQDAMFLPLCGVRHGLICLGGLSTTTSIDLFKRFGQY